MTKTNLYYIGVLAGALLIAGLLVTLLLAAEPARAAFPGGNGKIAFSSGRDASNTQTGPGEIYVMGSDGTGQTNLTNNPANDQLPAISPDETKIAFESDRDGNREVYVMDSGGQNPTRLTNNIFPTNDFDPTFSPDGTKIAFVSSRDGNNEIYVMDAVDTNADGNGDNPTDLTNNAASDQEPVFSPDGTKIAFFSTRDSNNQEIYMMDSNGQNQTRLTITTNSVLDRMPAFSPDGTKIAFASNRDGNFEVYVMNAAPESATNQPVRLTNNSAIELDPAFSPDGTKIAFRSDRDGNQEVYVMDAVDANSDGNGDNPTNLTNNGAYDRQPDWGVDKTAPPAPAITSPADNSYDNDGSFTISGTAEANSTVELFDGTDSKGTATTNASGDWSKGLNGVAEGSHPYTAKAKDAATNTSDLSNTRTVIVDMTTPTLDTDNSDGSDGVTPDNGATRVSRTTNIMATFSKAMDPATLETNSTVQTPRAFTLVNTKTGATVDATVSCDDPCQTVTLDPMNKLARRTVYEVKITTAAEDLASNPLDEEKTWLFKTKR